MDNRCREILQKFGISCSSCRNHDGESCILTGQETDSSWSCEEWEEI